VSNENGESVNHGVLEVDKVRFGEMKMEVAYYKNVETNALLINPT
jgi:hypothetical protein